MKEKSVVDQKISVLRDCLASQSKSLKCRDSKAKLIRRGYQNSDPEIRKLALECWQEFDVFYLIKELKTDDFKKLVRMACDFLLFENLEDVATWSNYSFYAARLPPALEYINAVKNWAVSGNQDWLQLSSYQANSYLLYPFTSYLQLLMGMRFKETGSQLNYTACIYQFPHYGNLDQIPQAKRELFLEYFPTPDSK